MRRDELRLQDILESADFILGVVGPLTEEEFLRNSILQGAVLQKLIVIGEAAGRLTVELRESYAAVPWSDMRRLRDQIAAILAAEFPPPDAV